MSTLSMISDDEADLPKVPPSEVGSLLTSWWLAIVFSIIVYLAILPMAPKPLVDGRITQTGWLTFGGLTVILFVTGVIIGAGIRSGKPFALGMCKLALIIGSALLIAAVAGVLVFSGGSKPADASGAAAASSGFALPLGPVPLLAVILLFFVVVLPLFFAALAFSFSGAQAVREWFNPPKDESVSYTAEETAGGAWEGAAGAGAGAAVLEAAPEPYIELAPSGGAPAPAGPDHFDALMQQELVTDQETVAYEPPPVTDHGGVKPTMIANAEELAAMVHGEPPAAASPEFMPEAVAESSVVSTPEPEIEADPVSSSVVAEPLAEVEAPRRSPPDQDVEEVVEEYVVEAEPDAEAGDAVEYVEEVEEFADEEGDGTEIKPVETWDFTADDEGEDEKKPKR